LGAVHGQVSFVDEMDSNIHDLLMKGLIESIVPDVKGQLIVTTHNTLLLENADPRSVYILQVDAEGGRSIQPMSSIERTQKNHNNRKRYLDGVMGGVPYMGEIYMSEIEREYFGGRNAP
jgi:AAA15 family ATPase/GTPase